MQAPVSVIIPCYRCVETIERAIASVTRQSRPPAEVLLVEDCSDDGGKTLELLYRLQNKYQGEIGLTITSFETNRGPAVARNAAWGAATQPYIAFLDADDEWHPEKLDIQYGYMRDHPQIAVTGHQYVVLPNGKPIPHASSALSYTRTGAISLLFRNYFPTSSVMLKRGVPFRFPAGRRYGEDAYLWRKLALAGFPIVRIEAPLVHYYKALYGEEGLSAQLWKMEKGELSSLLALYQEGSINWLLLVAAAGSSIAKYIKRLVVTRINRVMRFAFGGVTQ